MLNKNFLWAIFVVCLVLSGCVTTSEKSSGTFDGIESVEKDTTKKPGGLFALDRWFQKIFW